MNKTYRCQAGIFLAVAVVLLAGCMRTEKVRKVETTGFLNEKDYTLMRRTRSEIAQLLYFDPDIDYKAYDKMLIEPVTVWRSPESNIEDLPEVELEELGRYLHAALVEALGRDYKIVQSPEEGTIRVRVAITEASKSNVALDIITSVLPPGIGVNVAKRMSTGTHAFVGKAVIEADFRDATTGDLLAAGLAARQGGKTLLDSSKVSSWGDVKAAFDKMAEGIANTAKGLREGTADIEFKE
jgi:hypothetical protein